VSAPQTQTIDSARAYFEALIALGPEPRLHDATGTVEFDVEGEGRWLVSVDHGELAVAEGASPSSPVTAAIHCPRGEFLRMVRGEDHENLVTATLRGALQFEGDLGFLQQFQAVIPLPEARVS
jgi:hypothetical protein